MELIFIEKGAALVAIDGENHIVKSGSDGSIFYAKHLYPLVNDITTTGIFFDKNVDWQKDIIDIIKSVWHLCNDVANGYELFCKVIF